MWITSSLDTVLTPTAVALGNFDGLHQGHRRVIQPVLKRFSGTEAALLQPLRSSNVHLTTAPPVLSGNEFEAVGLAATLPYSTVVTFHPHPQEFFTGQPKKLLTPLDEKVELLKSMGVEQLVLLPFDRELADLSPNQFMEQILVRSLQVRQISVGFDFHFGKDRLGKAEDLQAMAHQYGIEVKITPLYSSAKGERVSSSVIRQALAAGQIQQVRELLGRPYSMIGQVVQGQQLGRTLGFPTANLECPPEKFLPQYGVYAVRVFIKSDSFLLVDHPAVMNVGCRPTVAGEDPTVEVYLLDWSGDLYGQTLTVTLEQFIRPEQRFGSLEALKNQIRDDCRAARIALQV